MDNLTETRKHEDAKTLEIRKNEFRIFPNSIIVKRNSFELVKIYRSILIYFS